MLIMNYKYYTKLIVLTIFLSATISSTAQEIRYELFVNNKCKDSIFKLNFFTLSKNGINYHCDNEDGILVLKEKGKYLISTIYFDEERNIEFKDYGFISDTINLKSVEKCYEPTSSPRFSGFCCCDSLCDGAKIDYYKNGNIRVQGTFKNGKAIGKVYYYHQNGKIRLIEKYNKKGSFLRRREFNSLGKRIRKKN